MVKIFIDDTQCDYDENVGISLSYKSSDMVNLESGRSGQTISFSLPVSQTNISIFGSAGDIHPQTKFNSQWHSMSVQADGATIFSGTAYLMQVVWSSTERYFVVECRGGVLEWASTASSTAFNSINISYSALLNEDNIKATWEDPTATVKFLPIVRDSYTSLASSADVTGLRIARSIDDYHPFFNVQALFEAIFKASGYSLQSSTMATELFENLYISGSYSTAENSAAKSAMGFYVKRSEDCTTTTDYSGRVSLSPYDSVATVGNLVDIETVLTDSECYNYGNVLQLNGEALEFVPLTQISVGFEYYLHYTCTTQIESAEKLKGIDTLNTVDNGYIKWEITNRHIDQRENVLKGITYKLFIFDFTEGNSYQLVSISSSGKISYIVETQSRVTEFVITQDYLYLEVWMFNTVGYQDFDGSWAIYYGYVEEYAQVEVMVTVRSSPTEYSPTSPMQFELQMLEGGCPTQSFTLYKDSSIKPFFAAYPGYNSSIKFEDIAQQDFTALEFLSSIQHMYNLRFATDQEAQVVSVESFDEFYNSQQWDWTSRVITTQTIEFVDLAHEAYRTTTYGYQQTDGVVQRYGQSDNDQFGEWSYTVDSYAASSSSQSVLNPFLCATINDDDGVLMVGDRDDLTTVDSLNFSPRIVRYFEMRAIEDENYSLPYASFHSPDDGFTLCFEDRDGAQGLNRLYSNYASLLQRAQQITMSIRLSGVDYINLFTPNSLSPSAGSIFYFELQGESFKTILQSIDSYNPISGVARCTFLTID